MSLRSTLFGDGTCPGCLRYRGACICRKATKVSGGKLKPVKGRAAPKATPYQCSQMCGYDRKSRSRTRCTSIIRDGRHCPCSSC